jgi:hypothetical protein
MSGISAMISTILLITSSCPDVPDPCYSDVQQPMEHTCLLYMCHEVHTHIYSIRSKCTEYFTNA